jgi:hypothetical protein
MLPHTNWSFTRSALVRASLVAVCLAVAASAAGRNPVFRARRDYFVPLDMLTVADANGDGIPDIIGLGAGVVIVLVGEGNGTFRVGPESNIETGGVYFPVAADVNGDGNVDLIFSGPTYNGTYDGVGISMGNGDGTFQPAVFYQTGNDKFLGSVVYGDFNGDGIPDIAVAGESGIWLFTGQGGGTFSAGALTPFSGCTGGLAAGDFNSDGHLDLALTTQTGFAVFPGNGNGTFRSPRAYSTGPLTGKFIVVGDLNMDGHPDIVLCAYTEPTDVPDYVLVYLGNGKGGFSAPAKVQMSPVQHIAIADINGDGIPDLVGSNGDSALGTGSGTFHKPVYYRLPALNIVTNYVVPADLRNNGLTDIVLQDGDGGISVLLNEGKGVYEDGEWLPVAGAYGCAAAADFNGDGKPDLAMNSTAGISILLGTGEASKPFESGATLALTDAGCPVVGSLTGGGAADLLVPSNQTVVAYLGNGGGGFTQASTTSTPGGGFLAVGDFNHDGKLDFATSGNLLALGNGDGTFQTPVTFAPDLYGGFTNIAAGDLNGDGWTDLVVTQDTDSFIYVLLNNQQGGFTVTKIVAKDGESLIDPTQIVLADLNGDGNLDIVTGSSYGGVAIYLGDGKGNFTYSAQLVIPTGVGGGSVVWVSDVNGDGIPDLVVTQAEIGTVGVFPGKGDGTFHTPYYVGAGPSPGDILLENLHGQPASCGMPDIVAPDVTGGVSVLINHSASTCPGL